MAIDCLHPTTCLSLGLAIARAVTERDGRVPAGRLQHGPRVGNVRRLLLLLLLLLLRWLRKMVHWRVLIRMVVHLLRRLLLVRI